MHRMRHRILSTAVLTAITPVLLAAAPAVHSRGAPRWRPVRTETPLRPVAGTYGPALAASDGRLWIGPARDTDVGDGPPQVTAVGVRAGFGLPSFGTATVGHPSADRTAGFGRALSAAGGMCMVGSPHAGCRERGCDSGQVHLLSPDHDGSWTVEQVPCPEPEPASEFGAAVATDGQTLVVGSPRADSPERDAGAVDVFDIGPAPDRAVTHVARIRPPLPAASARFGASVAVDRDWIAIGEPGAGALPTRPGAVHLLHRTAAGWQLAQTLHAPASAVGWYGASVALAGGVMIVGAPAARSTEARVSCGAAVVHALRGGTWHAERVITDPAATPGDGFGMSVALHQGWAAIGAPGDDTRGEDAGCAWITPLRGETLERLDARTPRPGDGFGAGLALGSAAGSARLGPTRFLAVSCHEDPERPATPGAVQLFALFEPQPVLLAQSVGPQSMSASSIAMAAEASVTTAGAQPADCARASTSEP